MKDKKIIAPTDTSKVLLADSPSTVTSTPIPAPTKRARLSVAERAYVRGMVALRDRKYPEAHRQLTGYLKLTEVKNRQAELTCEVLSLYLAIGREIAIIESNVG